MEKYQGYHFPDQHADEKIMRIVHRHWFVILFQFFFILFAVVLIAGSFFLLESLFPGTVKSLGKEIVRFLETTFLLFIWFYAFLVWIDYYLDTWIITNERIINIEQKGLFSREISELRLENIQDVTTEVGGFLPTILNFGYVYIQTAAERERFIFEQVPDPYTIKNLAMQLSEKAKACAPRG